MACINDYSQEQPLQFKDKVAMAFHPVTPLKSHKLTWWYEGWGKNRLVNALCITSGSLCALLKIIVIHYCDIRLSDTLPLSHYYSCTNHLIPHAAVALYLNAQMFLNHSYGLKFRSRIDYCNAHHSASGTLHYTVSWKASTTTVLHFYGMTQSYAVHYKIIIVILLRKKPDNNI